MNVQTVSAKVVNNNGEKVYKLNFGVLVIGRLVSDFGSAIFSFALSLYILEMTGSATAFSIVLGASILPQAIVNVFAGVFIDRSDKKRALIACEISSGIMVLVFMMVFRFNNAGIEFFIIYTIILNSIQAYFLLALNSSVPEIVDKENVERTNSVFQMIGATVKIGGPLLGAIAYRTIGLENIFLIDGISFLVAGVLKTLLKFPRGEDNNTGQSFMKEMTEVLNYIRSQKGTGFLFGAVIAINFMFLPLILLVLPYVSLRLLKLSEIQLALIQGGWAVGAVIGAIVISLLNVTMNTLFKRIFLCMQLQAVLIVLWIFPFMISPYNNSETVVVMIFCILLTIAGMLNAITNVASYAFIQLKVPRMLRARVFGVLNSANLVAVPLGMWIYGGLLQEVTWTHITSCSGLLLFAIALYVSMDRDFKALSENMDGD